MTVGERIKTLRKQKGYTQGDVATQLNMSRQAVAKWEQNVCEPNVNCLIVMAELFEVDLNYLITGKVEEKPNPWEKSQKLLKSLSSFEMSNRFDM